jgi:hypothetical protein
VTFDYAEHSYNRSVIAFGDHRAALRYCQVDRFDLIGDGEQIVYILSLR